MATFTSQQFAKAFVCALRENPHDVDGQIQRAVDMLKKSGKQTQLRHIIPLIEAEWHKTTGAKKFTVTAALPMIQEVIDALRLRAGDAVETKTDAYLIAGAIIKENDNRILDLSFRSRVNALFKN